MRAAVLAQDSFGSLFSAQSEIPRPPSIEAGAWRRFSRVARLAAAAAAPVIEAAPEVTSEVGLKFDKDEVPLFFGTGLGEYSSSYGFLKSLFTRGPAMASPLLFQNSVHNAAAGHLSIAFGLRGPSETLCAGALTTLRTFERALCWLEANGGCALVVLADDVNADSVAGWEMGGVRAPFGEGGAAFLLAASGGRSTVELTRAEDSGDQPTHPGDVLSYCTSDAGLIADALWVPGEHRFNYPGCALVVRGV